MGTPWAAHKVGRLAVKTKSGRIIHRKPTLKQILCTQYIAQGMSVRQARLKAGYSLSEADHGGKWDSPVVQTMIGRLKVRMQKNGLNEDYMAGKMKTWMEAKKTTRTKDGEEFNDPDYDTQLRAFKEWKDINQSTEPKSNEGVARRITLEEFIKSDPPVEVPAVGGEISE